MHRVEHIEQMVRDALDAPEPAEAWAAVAGDPDLPLALQQAGGASRAEVIARLHRWLAEVQALRPTSARPSGGDRRPIEGGWLEVACRPVWGWLGIVVGVGWIAMAPTTAPSMNRAPVPPEPRVALALVNEASATELRRMGVYAGGVRRILEARPFPSWGAFQRTPGIGPGTERVVRQAALVTPGG